MWIRGVNFPAELIDAHRAGTLVIFVGAGASMDAPSGLPNFYDLAVSIANEAQRPAPSRDVPLDMFLGKLADEQVNVHHRVAVHLSVSTSRPNRLHKALVALAVSIPPPRIVTTNYDLHLSTVLHDLGVDVREYIGPALPVGDDFSGVVYLHGSLQFPAMLVVTDGDFGSAYLRDAWAARFLERMFSTYTVLFVGYSHGDIVMQYLARALRQGKGRYVLTPTPDAPEWRRLRVHPVGYMVSGHSHIALVEAIEGWVSLTSMRLLDHRQQIARLVSAPPSQVPDEMSYLEAVISNPEQVRLFADLARREEWLSWAATQPEFQYLLDPSAALTECSYSLASWFAEYFIFNEVFTAAALAVVVDAGKRIGPTLWVAIAQHLHRLDSPRPDWVRPWLVLLIENAPEGNSEWLEYALVASEWPADRSSALLLFDYLTEPRLESRPPFGTSGLSRFDIQLRGSSHWLDEAWQRLFRPNLREAAPVLTAIVDRNLRRGFQLLAAGNFAGSGWDPVSFRRSAIRPHPRDLHREPLDSLIDAARDCLETLLNENNSQGIALIDAWANSEVPILRRLAVHGWVIRTDVDDTSKIAWLRQRGWLFDHRLHYEVFNLIETSLASSDPDIADGLVADAVAGPSEASDEAHRSYESFNVLIWMRQHAPDLQSVQAAYGQIQSANPQFAERAHPELLATWEFGTASSRAPMSAEDLHSVISVSPADAIAEIRRYEGREFPFDSPSWEDAVAVLTETVRKYPSDGLAILDIVNGADRGIVRAVIYGWSTATLDENTVQTILQRLARVDLAAMASEISNLLADGGRSDANPTEWHLYHGARKLAADLWSVIDTEPLGTDANDWLTVAINATSGRLARFWLQAISADWKAAGDTWAGLSPEIREQLELMLAGDDSRSAMAQIVLASQLLFFFNADRAWSEVHILPLLDWSDPPRARRTWGGYLIWGRWNDQLLTAGLLEKYLDAARRIDGFREELRRQLCSHLASIALYSGLDPLPWASKFAVTVAVAHRVEWMNQVTWMLDQISADAVERQWLRWMRKYWQNRLDSVPVQMTFEEASAIAAWSVYLTDSIADGVALATVRPAGLGVHSSILSELAEGDRLSSAPTEFAKLIGHLMRGTRRYGGYYLSRIVPKLRQTVDAANVDVIVEEAMRLGHQDAPGW